MPTTRRPKIVNAIWRLYPSTEFVEEIIGGNREMSLARAQNGHGRGKGLLRVVPSHYLQRLRSRRRLRRIAFATCCCGISKLNAARGQYRQQRSCAAGQVSILREGTEAFRKAAACSVRDTPRFGGASPRPPIRVFSYAAVLGFAFRVTFRNGLILSTAASAVMPCFFRKTGMVPCSTN